MANARSHLRYHPLSSIADDRLTDSLERFTTSWLLSPRVLAIIRAAISLYAFVVLLTIAGYDRSTGQTAAADRSLTFFTVLGYWGQAFYFAFATAHTVSYELRKNGTSWLRAWPRVLQHAHCMLYSSVTVFPFVVSIVFWSVLARGAFSSPLNSWTNVSEHALNSCFALFEIVLSRTDPLPWWHLIPLVAMLAMYLALASIVHATTGVYVYFFLNGDAIGRGVLAGVIIGILVLMIVVFVAVHFVIMLRKWYTETKLGMRGKTAIPRARLGGEEAGTMELAKRASAASPQALR